MLRSVSQVIEIVLRPGCVEVRFGARRGLLGWWRSFIRTRQQEREVRTLALLDEHLLKDIGLGERAGGDLAARVHACRQQELRRIAMARLGLM